MAAAAPAASPVLSPEALLETMVAIVSERTGYPVEMLDPDLDLEAELSIDSIKRIEILGELAERVGPAGHGRVGGRRERHRGAGADQDAARHRRLGRGPQGPRAGRRAARRRIGWGHRARRRARGERAPRRRPPRRRSGRGAARLRPARRRHRSCATCRHSSTCPRQPGPATWPACPWWWSTTARRSATGCTTSWPSAARRRGGRLPPRRPTPWEPGSTRSSI